jgi:uncharacterized protein (DUF488 family)
MDNSILHTIGYEGSSIEDFLATLDAAKIDLVIDVRDVPISRKRGFSKTALSNWLAASDIEYLHLKGLGDPKPGRLAARERRYDDFRKIFAAHMKSTAALYDISRGVEAAKGRFACLLCFERDHTFCHRCIVAEEMARRGGFRLVHLGVSAGVHTEIVRRGEPVHDRAIA